MKILRKKKNFGLIRYFFAIVLILILLNFLYFVFSISGLIPDIYKSYCSQRLIVKNEQKRFEIPNKIAGSSFFFIINSWKDMNVGSSREKFNFNFQYCNATVITTISFYEQRPETKPLLIGNVEANIGFLVERKDRAIYDFDETFRRYANSFKVLSTEGKVRLAYHYVPSNEFFGGSFLLISVDRVEAEGNVLSITKNASGISTLSIEIDEPTNQ